MALVQYSIFKSDGGRPIGKILSLIEGKLEKCTYAMSSGTVRRVEADSLAEFAVQLSSVQADEALCFGICRTGDAAIAPRAHLSQRSNTSTVSRTRDNFDWPDGPAIMMWDYDPPANETPLSPAELVGTLRGALAGLQTVTIAHKGSSSSCIVAPDGTVLRGMSGQHLFVVVDDGQQIPELARRIADRLWLTGHGRYQIAANGALLERFLFDLSVWQQERLVFIRAGCRSDLRQELPPVEIFPGSVDHLMDEGWLSADLIPPLTVDENRQLESLKRQAKLALTNEATRRREEWIEQHVAELSRGDGEKAVIRRSIVTALQEGRLPDELQLTSENGERVEVSALLNDPDRWHGQRFRDPVEPDYRDDPRVAVAMLKGAARPQIYSHAHGGIRYYLTSGGGSSPSALSEFEDLTRSTGKKKGLQIIPAAEFVRGPGVGWLIKGLLPQAALAMVYGPSGSGKSFFGLDLVWAIVTGRFWKGLRTQQGRALYVVAEGTAGFRNRLNAMASFYGPELNGVELGIIREGVDLRTNSHHELIALIIEHGGADLIVVDTLAQVVAGADENSGEEMGPALRRCQEIIEATGAAILLVHHAGKTIERGARGWSGIRAAMDTEIEITKDGKTCLAKVTKQKDGEEGQLHAFELRSVQLGHDEDGDPITSCVVIHLAAAPLKTRKLTGKWQKLIIEVVEQLEPFGYVRRNTLLDECCRAATTMPGHHHNRSRIREVLGRALNSLVSNGVLVHDADGSSFHAPTTGPQSDKLCEAAGMPPTPHDSRECGGVALTIA